MVTLFTVCPYVRKERIHGMALGLIEVFGFTTSIVVADAVAKGRGRNHRCAG